MDRFAHPSTSSPEKTSSREWTSVSPQLAPFGPLGGGQWTGHPIGLVIVLGFIAMALAGIPESRGFFALSLVLGGVLGCILWLRHRSKGFF